MPMGGSVFMGMRKERYLTDTPQIEQNTRKTLRAPGSSITCAVLFRLGCNAVQGVKGRISLTGMQK